MVIKDLLTYLLTYSCYIYVLYSSVFGRCYKHELVNDCLSHKHGRRRVYNRIGLFCLEQVTVDQVYHTRRVMFTTSVKYSKNDNLLPAFKAAVGVTGGISGKV